MEQLKKYLLQQISTKKLTPEEALVYLEELDLAASSSHHVEYAVIGMSCRFPHTPNLEAFWDCLINRRDSVGAFPKQRMDDVKYANARTFELYKDLHCRIGTYFDQIDLFDHVFFKLTPAEARVMDPNQRIFLETAIEALENAALTEDDLRKTNTGVFVGYSVNDDNYIDILEKNDPNIALGNQPSLLAYRLSFLYDMRGPTMIIDTACSSSLVAVHQACQSIALGDCDQAIVGGVNVRIFPAIREITNLGIEAFDGRCRTFDEKAGGTNIGDGVAAIIIKRRDLAEQDGDYIHAIIKGSAVNSDGSSNGLTSPNPEAQTAVLKAAWKQARIQPENLSFIETHGTGTKLGDPIEVLGLTQAFAATTSKKQWCPLGAVKTNIGHLEATSGLAGLIKTILCLQERTLPPNIHYHQPNPLIDFANSAVYPNSELLALKGEKLIAGVSSFGISGTNCHLIVEEYPQGSSPPAPLKPPYVFLFSVKTAESMITLLTKHLNWIKKHPNLSANDLSFTLARGRNHYDVRISIVADSLSHLSDKLALQIASNSIEEAAAEGIYMKNFSAERTPELTQLYLQNQPIDWNLHFPKGSGRKIPLPTYPFLQKRHWPKLEVEKKESINERLGSFFYELRWEEEPLNAISLLPRDQVFLFFIRQEADHEAFADFTEAQGISTLRIYSGASFRILDEKRCEIRADSFEDYKRLVEWALGKRSRLFGGVIHLWDCLPPSNKPKEWEEIKNSQTHGAFSAFHLINALNQSIPHEKWKFVTGTTYAHKIGYEKTAIDPTRMPALGINKVASQEFPLVESLALDLELKEEIFPLIYAEIFTAEKFKDAVVGYREGKRYIQVLERKEIFSLPNREIFLRDQGVYVIAGGGGYLGLATARLLAEKKKVRIALFGRKDPQSLSEKQKRQIAEIEQLGSEVVYLSGDVTNFESCQSLVQEVERKWGSVHGLFVAMKNISHQRLDTVTFERLSSNILAKVKGTWLLDTLTRKWPLDFMATFSSISSLTGGPTGADCCASNLFLDSFGDWRNEQQLPTITVNYTLIEADDGSLLSDRMSMIPPLTKEEFLQTLDLSLTKKMKFALIADFNTQVMNLVLPFMKIRFSSLLGREFEQVKTEIRKEQKIDFTLDEMIKIMQKIWKDVLGFDEIDRKANFFQIGGESISAIKLLHLAKVQLQVNLEISDLYSYPILEDLCRSIEERQKKKEDKKSLSQLLEDFQSGKIDLHETAKNL